MDVNADDAPRVVLLDMPPEFAGTAMEAHVVQNLRETYLRLHELADAAFVEHCARMSRELAAAAEDPGVRH